MKSKSITEKAYNLLRQSYVQPVTTLLNTWKNSDDVIIGPSGIFPPQDFSSFGSEAAEEAFFEYNCAILTAFRGEDDNGRELSRSENEERNRNLLRALSRLKKKNLLDFLYYINGCYKEENRPDIEQEDSFFIYANNNIPEYHFFSEIYRLSEKYNQDSFLYKCAGGTTTAFLLFTNNLSRERNGLIKTAGELQLDFPEEGPYTNLPAGRIKFQIEKPTPEQIAYSERHRDARKRGELLKRKK